MADNLDTLLYKAGFRGNSARLAKAVMLAESSGRASAHNYNPNTGDDSYGLFQINMLGDLGPARRRQYGLQSNQQLLDPLTNARIAYQLSQGGANWNPWSAYKSGAYKKFLGGGQSPSPNLPEHTMASSPAPTQNNRSGLLSFLMESNRALMEDEEQPSIVQYLMQGRGSSDMPLEGSQSLSNALPYSIGAQLPGNVVFAKGADRPGAPTQKSILDYAARVAGIYGKPLRVGTGTNHNRFVAGTNRESAHWQGNALDIPSAGQSLVQMGQAALIAAGADARWARKQKGGLFNIGGYQVIFNTDTGGNHYDHLHIGVRR